MVALLGACASRGGAPPGDEETRGRGEARGEPAAPRPTETAAAATCTTEADALAASLRTAGLHGGAWASFDLALVPRPELTAEAPSDTPQLELGVDGTSFDGVVLGPSELRDRLAAAYRRQEERRALEPDRPDPAVITLQIDGRVPWSRVVEAWRAAHDAGMRAPVFVFAAPAPTPPPRAPIDDELDALPDGRRAAGYGELLARELAPCPALVRAFDQLATYLGDDRPRRQVDALARALVACRCAVDLPALRAVLWRVLVNPRPVTSLRFDAAAPATPLALPASMPWAEASTHFTPALRNATLRVRGR